jgi:hypothetical protein
MMNIPTFGQACRVILRILAGPSSMGMHAAGLPLD